MAGASFGWMSDCSSYGGSFLCGNEELTASEEYALLRQSPYWTDALEDPTLYSLTPKVVLQQLQDAEPHKCRHILRTSRPLTISDMPGKWRAEHRTRCGTWINNSYERTWLIALDACGATRSNCVNHGSHESFEQRYRSDCEDEVQFWTDAIAKTTDLNKQERYTTILLKAKAHLERFVAYSSEHGHVWSS